jgi:FMN phosphatase YigB (HAD superfamily)
MPPSFVYFDLGNVIVTFDRDLAFRQMAAACGADPSRVREAVMDGLQADLERGSIDWLGFHREFGRRTGTESDPEALAVAAADMFALNVEILPVVAALQRRGIPIGILSNTCEIHWRHLLGRGWGILPGSFRPAILSYELGASKPERAIFERAAERAGTPPERIFFCDDLPEHIAAARAAGWDAEVFKSAGLLADQLDRRGIRLGL